jgi:hypothetical protein
MTGIRYMISTHHSHGHHELELPEEKRAERAKNEQFPLFIPRATARRGHCGIRPMVYILKGKVSSLRQMTIIWTRTASSDAARQACGEAAASWGSAQAVTFYRPISKSRSGEMRWKLIGMGWGRRRRMARAGRRAAEAACGWALRQRRAKRRDERPEGPGRSASEEPAESRGDRYWRSHAYSR